LLKQALLLGDSQSQKVVCLYSPAKRGEFDR